MAKNIKFLTGNNLDNLPAYSAATVGQVYFYYDTTNSDRSKWDGKIVYDSPTGRLVMSTHALDAEVLKHTLTLENGQIFNGSANAAIANTVHFVVGNSAAEGAWTGQDTTIKEYYDGLMVMYLPNKAGGSTKTTLKINNLAAVDCYYNNTDLLKTQLPTSKPILFVMSGGVWRRPGSAIGMKVEDETLKFYL